MQLLELKQWYNRYKEFWPEWKLYSNNGLNEKDLIAIEVFIANNFSLDTKALEIFHDIGQINERLILPLIKIFKNHYREYKEWIIIKFQFTLVKMANEYGMFAFFNVPIKKLRIAESLKDKLGAFNCVTVEEISNKYSDEDFYNDDTFIHILKFKTEILKYFLFKKNKKPVYQSILVN